MLNFDHENDFCCINCEDTGCDYCCDYDDYDDSMDGGDAGFGTDEDYGYYYTD